MRTKMLGVTVICMPGLLAPGSGWAQEGPPGPGVSLGARSGYAFPIGRYEGGASRSSRSDLSQLFSGMIPLWLDAGYRFNPSTYAGAYIQLAYALVPNCLPGASCSGTDIRIGVNAQYRFLPDSRFGPWAGVGAGYEVANLGYNLNGVKSSDSLKGFEFLNLQLGADYAVSSRLRIGPFGGFTLAMFFWGDGGPLSLTAVHDWLFLGLRGQFDL